MHVTSLYANEAEEHLDKLCACIQIRLDLVQIFSAFPKNSFCFLCLTLSDFYPLLIRLLQRILANRVLIDPTTCSVSCTQRWAKWGMGG